VDQGFISSNISRPFTALPGVPVDLGVGSVSAVSVTGSREGVSVVSRGEASASFPWVQASSSVSGDCSFRDRSLAHSNPPNPKSGLFYPSPSGSVRSPSPQLGSAYRVQAEVHAPPSSAQDSEMSRLCTEFSDMQKIIAEVICTMQAVLAKGVEGAGDAFKHTFVHRSSSPEIREEALSKVPRTEPRGEIEVDIDYGSGPQGLRMTPLGDEDIEGGLMLIWIQKLDT